MGSKYSGKLQRASVRFENGLLIVFCKENDGTFIPFMSSERRTAPVFVRYRLSLSVLPPGAGN